jgi:DNA-binding NtrC family response regulator
MQQSAIMIVDGDAALCRRVKALLCPQGLAVHEMADPTDLLNSLPSRHLRVLVVESTAPGPRSLPGVEVAERHAAARP